MMITTADIKAMSPNKLVSWFMIGCYAYYRLGTRVIEDCDFDYLVQRLKSGYNDADHHHKRFITEDHLNAGTGYDIEFPTIVKYATRGYMKEAGLW